MRGKSQLEALTEAMRETKPARTGDDRFIADQITDADAAMLRRMCRGCPLLEACMHYANAAVPEAGFWAGREYSARSKTVERHRSEARERQQRLRSEGKIG